MPKRMSTFKVESDIVQGDGSWVLFRAVPYELVTEAAGAAAGETNPAYEIEFTERLLKVGIAKWNWVDDDDKPMPTPQEGLPVGKLLTSEIEFLVNSLLGTARVKK